MGKEATAYIFSFDSKSGVFTLTSSKDQLTIDSKHKKYEWLKGQESGRVIKISATGRWNSSRDYDNLYQSIKPKKKVLKKSKTSKTNTDKAGEYCFSFRENEFVLTDQNGREIKITSKHKKFEWLESQDSGRVIKISEKGRWNSSKDYDGLYQIVKSSHKKQTKPKTQKPKTDSSGEIKKLKEEIKNLQSTIHNLRDELKRLGSNYNELKKENAQLKDKIPLLENRIIQLKKKASTTKTTSNQNKKSLYKVKITAVYTYYDSIREVQKSKPLKVKFITDWLDKKPPQSLFKSYLKLALNASIREEFNEEQYFNLPLRLVQGQGLSELSYGSYYKKKKISDITFTSMEVWRTK